MKASTGLGEEACIQSLTPTSLPLDSLFLSESTQKAGILRKIHITSRMWSISGGEIGPWVPF